MRGFVIAVLTLGLIASAAPGDVPDPSNCTCDLDELGRALLIPGGPVPPPNGPWQPNGHADFCVNVRNAANAPINNAIVVILIAGLETGHTCLCDLAETVKHTDMYGNVCFNIPGGGCLKHQYDAFLIRANGVVIRTYDNVMSPDYTGRDDDGIPGRCDLMVTPEDLAAFILAYMGGTGPASCHDYDNDGITGPIDLGVFITAYHGGVGRCPP